MVMDIVDPELVSVAVPVTLQFVDKLPEFSQFPDAVSVAFVSVELPLFVVVKFMLPETTLEEAPQVTVKL